MTATKPRAANRDDDPRTSADRVVSLRDFGLDRALDDIRAALEGPHETERLIASLRRTRADLDEANRRLQSSQTLLAQYRITRVLLDSSDLDDAAPKVAQIIASEFDWDQALLWVRGPDQELKGRVIWPEARMTGSARTTLPGEELVHDVWVQRACRWLEDTGAADSGDWGSHVAFPICTGLRPIGVIELRSMLPRRSDSDLVTMLVEVGVKVAEFTQRRRAEQELRRREAETRALLNALPDTILAVRSDGTVVDYRGGRPDTGIGKRAIVGETLENAWPGIPSGFREAVQRAIATQAPQELEYAIEAPGLRRDYETRIVPMDRDTTLAVIRDITDRRCAERLLQDLNAELESRVRERTNELAHANAELRHISATDPLTGLFNRRHLFDRIPGEAARVLRSLRPYDDAEERPRNAHLGIMLLDLDHFKSVNDDFGHDVGDAVLQQLVQRLKLAIRSSDNLYRWGGEEFLVVAHDTEARELGVLAERIRDIVGRTPFVIPGLPLKLTCSLGYACYPLFFNEDPPFGWQDVLRVADQALYRAKRAGRDTHVGVVSKVDVLEPDDVDTVRRDLAAAAGAGLVEFMEPDRP